MDYSEYEIEEDGPVYTFDNETDSVTVTSIFPRDDMDGEKIEVTDGEKFTRFGLNVADQLMYMDTQQMAKFVEAIDDPALLRSIILSQKNLQHQLNFELQEERVMHANTEEQKNALEDENTPLGDEDLLEMEVGEAIKQLSEHEVSLVDYDYARINEESGTDEQVADYTNRDFESLTGIMLDLQQEDFPKGVPHNLLQRLAADHLDMSADEVDATLNEGLETGQIHEYFPHHYQAYWP
ncbi:hypothetical protein [Halorussus marinus]|uniref:hypothetical protein n=1 Tax=Halorussus marinus TaxID=2505976 RepID=UPI00106ED917|nr:hypothetical protein [Halorussus marinus]